MREEQQPLALTRRKILTTKAARKPTQSTAEILRTRQLSTEGNHLINRQRNFAQNPKKPSSLDHFE
jgi:hypothetical protein